MKIKIRKATRKDKIAVLQLLDEFRTDCMFQRTKKEGHSDSAIEKGIKTYDDLLERDDYVIYVFVNENDEISGVVSGYLCPMLRTGNYRAEVEEFFVKKEYRGQNIAKKLMDRFFEWCISKEVVKVNLESDNELQRAHSFYKKYGFETSAQRFMKKIS